MANKDALLRLLFKLFCLQPFSLKIQFLYSLRSSVAPWSGPMVDTEEKVFEIQVCSWLENAFFLDFAWNFRVLWGVLKKGRLERYIELSFMCVCQYLNQRVRRIGEQNGKFSKGVFKTKKKKKHEEIDFHNSIQDLVFTTV